MSQPRHQSPRKRSAPQPSRQQNKTPILYIIIVSVMVFSLIIAGLAAVDWSSLFPETTEPTPDYSTDQIAVWQTAVAEDPDDPELKMTLASMMANSGRIQDAVPLFEGAIRLDPENGEYRRLFAESLQKHGMSFDAEAQFLKSIEVNPDDHRAHYYLAQLYMDWQPKRQDEAAMHFERVIEIAPDSFYAEQAMSVLDTLGRATPTEYEVTPISSPTYQQ